MSARCPECKTRPTWSQRWRWSTAFGTRRIAPCPQCGTPLRWTALVYLQTVAALGLLIVAGARLLASMSDNRSLAMVQVVFSVFLLIGALGTGLERAEPGHRDADVPGGPRL